MSTRSVIARVGEHEGEFSGVYHHWDGYPTGLGQAFWKLLHGHFHGDLSAMSRTLIDKHPAGWSTIVGKDFNLKPGYTWQSVEHPSGSGLTDAEYKIVRAKYEAHPDVRRPQCFCHGKRHEPAQQFTHADLNENNAGLEWAYIFDEETNRMYVRDLNHGEEIIVELGDPEPDWKVVECSEDLSRCGHVASYHGIDSPLSVQTYLGKRPLEFHDAIAFMVNGKRLKNSGSGGDADFLSRTHTTRFPSGTWVQSVIAGNGRRLEVPVAKRSQEGFAPLPGVQWVMPPTKNNPQETLVSA